MRTKEQTSAQNKRYHERNRAEILARQKRTRQARKNGPDWKRWATKRMLDEAKTRANRQGLAFSITAADVVIPDQCPIFGLPLHQTDGRTWSSPSIDRLDNRLGYVPGNVWVISWRANNIKGDATPKELRAVARGVERRLREVKAARKVSLPILDGRQHAEWPR